MTDVSYNVLSSTFVCTCVCVYIYPSTRQECIRCARRESFFIIMWRYEIYVGTLVLRSSIRDRWLRCHRVKWNGHFQGRSPLAYPSRMVCVPLCTCIRTYIHTFTYRWIQCPCACLSLVKERNPVFCSPKNEAIFRDGCPQL